MPDATQDDADDTVTIEEIQEIAYPQAFRISDDLLDVVHAVDEDPLDTPDGLLDDYRYPDAREAEEYFDIAEQYSKIEVEIEHAGLEGMVSAEVGNRWRAFVDRPVTGAPIDQIVAVPAGLAITDAKGQSIRIESVGLFEDHSEVYEPLAELVQRIADAEASEEEIAGHAIQKMVESERQHIRNADSEAGSA